MEVSTFDFGMSCRARPAYDVSYYLVMSQPPFARRERSVECIYRYLKEYNGEDPTGEQMAEFHREMKIASLAIIALVLMTRLASRRAGFYSETRETQTRMLRWINAAVEEWESHDVDLSR